VVGRDELREAHHATASRDTVGVRGAEAGTGRPAGLRAVRTLVPERRRVESATTSDVRAALGPGTMGTPWTWNHRRRGEERARPPCVCSLEPSVSCALGRGNGGR
jgi:hypothetical protein